MTFETVLRKIDLNAAAECFLSTGKREPNAAFSTVQVSFCALQISSSESELGDSVVVILTVISVAASQYTRTLGTEGMSIGSIISILEIISLLASLIVTIPCYIRFGPT